MMTDTKERENEYIAKPPGECCTRGSIHTGTPRGSFDTIAGMETYVCRPPPERDNGHIMLYFLDGFGIFINGQLIMDAYDDAGYTVLAPDYFYGDPIWMHRKDGNRDDNTTDPGFDHEAWWKKYVRLADENVPIWVREVKQKYGKEGTKYACVGYCFGAPYVCDQLASDDGCLVGAFAHPTFLKDHHLRNLKRT